MPTEVEYLLTSQQKNGGWGYSPGQRGVVEPTALVLLALREDPRAKNAVQRGMEWLLQCQNPDGGWGINEDDHESGWQTSWAILALDILGHRGDAFQKAIDWLLAMPTSQVSREKFTQIEQIQTDDPWALVWPWQEGQVGWIEPTALAVLALSGKASSPVIELRFHAAIDYFIKNRTPSGGWDIGNAGPLDTLVIPRIFPTALVLMALAKAAKDKIKAEDISALRQELESDSSVLSLSSGILALASVGNVAANKIEQLKLAQLEDGSWGKSHFFTAMSMLGIRGKL